MCEGTEWIEKIGKDPKYDLIINNMGLHWMNDVQGALQNFHNSLVPDGMFMSCSLGGDTLQELRICMNLAE
jgi:NADH dehydrogenase [ubiquinone] 1 alpha subcomplex assembly factor 5